MAAEITVVLNPAAGRGTARAIFSRVRSVLDSKGIDYEVLETTGSGHATELARQAAENGSKVVVAAGGDGTLCEVVNGIIGSGATLGLVPIGTGNDFARAMSLSRDPERLADQILSGSDKEVDLGMCGEKWFINLAGCGFDAHVAKRINQGFRFLHGTSAYVAAVLTTLARYRCGDMCVEVDGQKLEGRFMLCAIANATSYGGGMKVAPLASYTDGLFDVVLVKELSKFEFVRQFPKVFKGEHMSHPAVVHLRGKRVSISCSTDQPVLIDGELAGSAPVEFELHPKKIAVRHPAHSEVE